jgi:hypothetical protein
MGFHGKISGQPTNTLNTRVRKARMTDDAWYLFDEGRSVGLLGTEEGIIIRDEEHPDGARITLEREASTPVNLP